MQLYGWSNDRGCSCYLFIIRCNILGNIKNQDSIPCMIILVYLYINHDINVFSHVSNILILYTNLPIYLLYDPRSDPQNYSFTNTNNHLYRVAESGFYLQTYLRTAYCIINIVLYHMSHRFLYNRRIQNVLIGNVEPSRLEIASSVVIRRLSIYPFVQVFGNIFYIIYLISYGYTLHISVPYYKNPLQYILQILANSFLVAVPIGEFFAFLILQPGAWDFLLAHLNDITGGQFKIFAPTGSGNAHTDYAMSSAFHEYRESNDDDLKKDSNFDEIVKNEDIHLCQDTIIRRIIHRSTLRYQS